MSEKRIFVSYRREDSAGHAGRLYDYLVSHFGAEQVFQDIDAIVFGEDFLETIERALRDCDVLIVIIGKQWLSIEDTRGRRRLELPDDVLRLEIETALASNLRVIPVLVQGATMPSAEELPQSLARLARRHAIEVSDSRFQYDANRLRTSIEHARKELAARKTPSPATGPLPSKTPRPPVPARSEPPRPAVPPVAETLQPVRSAPKAPPRLRDSLLSAMPGTTVPLLRGEVDLERHSRFRVAPGKSYWTLACISLGLSLFGVFEFGIVVFLARNTRSIASSALLNSPEALLLIIVSVLACYASVIACRHAMRAKAALVKSDVVGARDAAEMARSLILWALIGTAGILTIFFIASWSGSRWPNRPVKVFLLHFMSGMTAIALAWTVWFLKARQGPNIGSRDSTGARPGAGSGGTRAKAGA